MTWLELKQRIESLTEEQLGQKVFCTYPCLKTDGRDSGKVLDIVLEDKQPYLYVDY